MNEVEAVGYPPNVVDHGVPEQAFKGGRLKGEDYDQHAACSREQLLSLTGEEQSRCETRELWQVPGEAPVIEKY
jgi:hypothetical protein